VVPLWERRQDACRAGDSSQHSVAGFGQLEGRCWPAIAVKKRHVEDGQSCANGRVESGWYTPMSSPISRQRAPPFRQVCGAAGRAHRGQDRSMARAPWSPPVLSLALPRGTTANNSKPPMFSKIDPTSFDIVVIQYFSCNITIRPLFILGAGRVDTSQTSAKRTSSR
jgi:hypothetical protein